VADESDSAAQFGINAYRPREPFKDFHNREQRWAAMVCHRRAGKTVACIADLVLSALATPKHDGRFAYVAPQFNQAKDIAWTYIKRLSADIPAVQYNETELRADLPNGARIRLYGADNPDRLRGLYLDGVILDEYADMKPRIWGEIVRPLLTDRKGWAAFIGTPKGHNEFYEIWRFAQTERDWFSLMLMASESGIVNPQELADARRGMTDDQYEQEFECSFEAAIAGAFYGREMAQAERDKRIAEVAYDPEKVVHTAWDLGYRDDTAIWWFQVIRDEIHVIDFHASSGADVGFYAGLVSGKLYKYGTHYLPHDARAKTLASGGRSIIEQLGERLGFGNMQIVPELSVQDGIQAVRMALPRCWFDREKCGDGLEALKQYQREWDEDKKVFREKPRHDWTSHPADAFRMLAIAWRENAPPAPPPEPLRGITVGAPSVTLNELWAMMPRNSRRI
jgi:hypothetical protein